jgi:hypothetical protein
MFRLQISLMDGLTQQCLGCRTVPALAKVMDPRDGRNGILREEHIHIPTITVVMGEQQTELP